MKPGTVAFVNPNQPPSALCVIKECARDIGCQAYTVPSLDNYNWSAFPPNELGLFKVSKYLRVFESKYIFHNIRILTYVV